MTAIRWVIFLYVSPPTRIFIYQTREREVLKRRVVSLQGAKHKFNIAPPPQPWKPAVLPTLVKIFRPGSPNKAAARIKIVLPWLYKLL
jgi:hypothetical protein